MTNMREQKTESVYLNEYSDYTKEDIVAIIDDLFEKAKYLHNPKLVFESTMEPYEDYPGPVEVYVQGYRPLTEQEIEEDKRQDEIQSLANKLGVTFYEAATILDLKKRGKINV